jgi:hypothetical protein
MHGRFFGYVLALAKKRCEKILKGLLSFAHDFRLEHPTRRIVSTLVQ